MKLWSRRCTSASFVWSLRVVSGFARSGALSSSVRSRHFFLRASDNDNVNNNNVNGSGRTGWTHSTPDESSKFWKSSVENRDENIASSNSNGNGNNKPLRTGWLHNTQSRQALEEQQQQQQQQQKDTTTPARKLLQAAMLQKERNHRIVTAPTFHAAGDETVVAVTQHKLSVPLVHGGTTASSSPRLDVFFTVCEKIQSPAHRTWLESLCDQTPSTRAQTYVHRANLTTADDLLLYLQGGPGFGAPTPIVSLALEKSSSSWAGAALSQYDRIVLMDQRGTGRSTPVTKQSLETKFPDLFLLDNNENNNNNNDNTDDPEIQARWQTAVDATVEYMAQFRADHIVQDAELIKEALLQPLENAAVDRPWGACLGQSFGGFCILTYLSQTSATPPKVCLLTGGIGPAFCHADQVYTSLWHRVRDRSLQYYEMYPDDVALVRTIVRALVAQPTPLPSGGTLTARRFLQLGLALGGSPSSFARLHDMVQTALMENDDNDVVFSRAFLKAMETEQSYDDAPLYFWLHESIYADGPQFAPTQWAADRAYQALVQADAAVWDYHLTSAVDAPNPVVWFGEMTFPWMAQDYGELKGVGLQAVANALAHKTDWPPLYNAEQMKRSLTVTRAAAAVYVDDMYVDFDICRQLTARGQPLDRLKVWITNDYQHSGLRDDGATIFHKLHGMAMGSIRTPS